jgi:hypothetical protein
MYNATQTLGSEALLHFVHLLMLIRNFLERLWVHVFLHDSAVSRGVKGASRRNLGTDQKYLRASMEAR